MKNIFILILFCFSTSAFASVELTIKKADGSTYWTERFGTQAECDAWLAREKTRSYWKSTYTSSVIDTSPSPAEIAAIAAAAKAADDDRLAKLTQAKALRTSLQTSSDPKDKFLLYLLNQELAKIGQ